FSRRILTSPMCLLMTPLWCTGLHLPPILITPTPIRVTCQEQLWHGARELRWVPLLGGLGAATGAIAIGTAATLRSTTIIITRTTISTATSAAKAATGSTMRNTAGMHLTGTGKRRISSGVRVLVAQAALAGLAAQVAQEALAELVAQVAQEALAGLAVQVAQE